MLLQSLIRQFHQHFDPDATLSPSTTDVEITGVREDSRQVRAGDLFVARAGTKADGARFIADAQARGAVAAVVAARLPGLLLPQLIVKDPASAASGLANLFYGSPSATL